MFWLKISQLHLHVHLILKNPSLKTKYGLRLTVSTSRLSSWRTDSSNERIRGDHGGEMKAMRVHENWIEVWGQLTRGGGVSVQSNETKYTHISREVQKKRHLLRRCLCG